MKKVLLNTLAASILFAAMAAFTLSKQSVLQVNPDKSNITWTGKKVTGEHTGNVRIKSGTVQLTDGKISGGNFVIDMTSITCTDLTNEEYNQKLVGHLKSDDFFSTQKHPEAKLVISSVSPAQQDEYAIKGQLTIKGKTLPVEFPAKVITDGKTLSGTAKIDVNRTSYDIKYGSGSFFDNLGDKAIDDIFTLNINIIAKI